MEDYDDYADLTLEAEQLVVGLSSRIEMIKDRMEFKLRRGSVKVNIELEEKMLEIERQKAEILTPKVTNWSRETKPGKRNTKEETWSRNCETRYEK